MGRRGATATVSLFFAAAFCALAIVPACEDDPDTPERNVYDVFYSLNVTGQSTVDSVTYFFSGREAVAHNPPLDWKLHIQAGDGDTVFATATGTAENGMIVLFMRIEPTSGTPIERSDQCEKSSGAAAFCSLSTGDVTLK
jgi:hypothetical protein